MEDNFNLKDNIETLTKGVHSLQDKNDQILKKYDGLLADQKVEMEKGLSKTAEDIQKFKISVDENSSRIKDLEKVASSISGNMTVSKFKEINDEYRKHARAVLRDSTQKTSVDKGVSRQYVDSYIDERFKHLDSSERECYKKSLYIGSNPNGGYLVLPDIRTDVEVTRTFETSPIRQVASQFTTASNRVIVPVDDEEFDKIVYRTEQEASLEADNAQLGQLEINIHDIKTNILVTQSLLEDASVDVEAWVRGKIDRKITRVENRKFIKGTGANEPKGILSYAAWAVEDNYESNKLETLDVAENATTINADKIINLQNSLIEEYRQNATWMMNRNTFGKVMTLKSGDGHYLLRDDIIREGAELFLMGDRVLFATDIPKIGQAVDPLVNDKVMIYGDFSAGYTIFDRLGIQVLVDPYTQEPFIKYRVTKRAGGAVTSFDSLKIGKMISN